MEISPSPTNEFLRSRLSTLRELQKLLSTEPYSVILRLRLATIYKLLGYPDLSAGDAYKALLLIDEIVDEGEYHEQALNAATSEINSGKALEFSSFAREVYSGLDHTECCCLSQLGEQGPSGENFEDGVVTTWAKTCWSKIAYHILVECLINCGCLRSAFDYNARAVRAFQNGPSFKSFSEILEVKLRSHFDAKGENLATVDVQEYPDKGLVRRELYPWNLYEPDRFSPEVLDFLNTEMAKIAPKLVVKIADLPILSHKMKTTSGPSSMDPSLQFIKQFGVFARENISPGEKILQEKSLLTAVSRMHESYCDACSASLPSTRRTTEDPSEDSYPRACEDCAEVFFCSAECEDLAQMQYHPALCGVDLEQKVPASEAADSLYTLLLVRALALTETQGIHPLQLQQVRYIWGDYHGLDINQEWKAGDDGNLIDSFASLPQTLPFSFTGNILTPLHILEKMDVNIFEQSHRYDTWVFNTLYAKFRGTASARQGLDGRPEIGAVHPMWCLANHSCDPNVAWEWQGSIKFWARKQLVDWQGGDLDRKAGLLQGDEVFSHYCDIRLPVKERREWAIGALGGDCICPRCVWEDNEQNHVGAPE